MSHPHPWSVRRRRAGVALGAAAALLLGFTVLPAPVQAADPVPPRPIVSGWLPYWATDAATTSFLANRDLFSDVSPFWYTATWSGGPGVLEQVSATSKARALPQLLASGVPVLPTMTDSMGTHQLAAVLVDPALRASFVSAIVGVVVTDGYSGIDLDFEGFAWRDGRATWATTRPAWVTFVRQLSGALHASGKLLAVTTPPIYDSLRTTSSGYWVYDWAGIAPYVDRLRVMAYDYSVASPGPIAPFSWVERVVAYAVTQVPSRLVQIGVPAYGRDWVARTTDTQAPHYPYAITGTCPSNAPAGYLATNPFTAARALTDIPARASSSATVSTTAAVRTWDPVLREVRATYAVTYKGTGAGATSCRVPHVAWYENGSATLARAALVDRYHLRGLAQWAIGGEDPTQWSRLRSYAQSIAPSATAVALWAPAQVVSGTVARIVGRAVSDGSPVVGATALLYARTPRTTHWSLVARTLTSTTGHAVFHRTITRHVQLRLVVQGSFDRGTGVGLRVVRARTALTLVAPARQIKGGTQVRATVSLGPVSPTQKAVRWQAIGHAWVPMATVQSDSAGRASFTFRPARRAAEYRYRISVPGTASSDPAAVYFVVTAG